MKFMEWIHWFVLTLVIIGALNWGMVGFFNIDIITGVFGGTFQISRIIFAIVGIAGLWSFLFYKKIADEPEKK